MTARIWPLLATLTLTGHTSASATMENADAQAEHSIDAIAWREFNTDAFKQARDERKPVLLNLVAVWCHWCHVMDAKTYRDPRVAELIRERFVAVRADHDARPDLAERYREWGWPATIVIGADGSDIAKRAGYLDAEAMLAHLRTVIDAPDTEPRTGPAFPANLPDPPRLSDTLRAALVRRHDASFDTRLGGLNIAMKFVDQDSVLWSLRRIAAGDATERKRLIKTLDAAVALIDPAFGGAYQYSTHGDWDHPHFEKVMKTQWSFLLSYSRACVVLDQPRYCDAGRSIAVYLTEFLTSPEGAFFTSQDADLTQGIKAHDYFALPREARLRRGLPRIDKHIYTAANGMAIEGLAELYRATGDRRYLQQAQTAAAWIARNRPLWGGGFRHDRLDNAGPYLADTLAMGRAWLALYLATGADDYVQRALRAADFIDRQFRHPQAGLVSATDNGTPVKPLPQIDQNIQAALWLAELHTVTGAQQPLRVAEHVMRYLAIPEIATDRVTEAGILEADARLVAPP